MKKSNVMPTAVLGSICLAVTLILAVVNMFTAPIIANAQEEKANEALREVYPEGEEFEEIDSLDGCPAAITKVYREKNGGYVFQSTVTGYKPGLVIMCGVGTDGKVTGAKFIASNETLEAEVGLGEKFVGHSKDSLNKDIVAGPTAKLTTGAYYKAIEASLEAFEILSGEAE